MKAKAILAYTLLAAAGAALGAVNDSWIINGVTVEDGKFPEIVQIRVGNGSCSATVVGPNVILTAAHCADDSPVARFLLNGKVYSAHLIQSDSWQGEDNGDLGIFGGLFGVPENETSGLDLAIGITKEEIVGAEPVTIGGKASKGLDLTLLGYGCTKSNGHGGNDGVLRMGESVVNDMVDTYMVSKYPSGATLCFGDSGGPTYVGDAGAIVQLGVHSKGNLRSTNIDTRTDLTESQTFLKNVAEKYQVDICGVTGTCAKLSTDRFQLQ